MANFTKTLTNSLNLFGGSPSSKWGQVAPFTFTWGTTKWGEGSFSVIYSFDKVITNSIAPDTALSKLAQKLISNGFTAAGDMSSEISSNGIWRIVFVSDTINVEDRDEAFYTSGSASVASFVCQTARNTSWT